VVVTVRGLVQGVGYRWFARREAEALDIHGWVANRPDGAVDIIAEGRPDDLGRLVERLRAGPPAAVIHMVDVRSEPARGLSDGFLIRSGEHAGD
jgi:acylphosphatase